MDNESLQLHLIGKGFQEITKLTGSKKSQNRRVPEKTGKKDTSIWLVEKWGNLTETMKKF